MVKKTGLSLVVPVLLDFSEFSLSFPSRIKSTKSMANWSSGTTYSTSQSAVESFSITLNLWHQSSNNIAMSGVDRSHFGVFWIKMIPKANVGWNSWPPVWLPQLAKCQPWWKQWTFENLRIYTSFWSILSAGTVLIEVTDQLKSWSQSWILEILPACNLVKQSFKSQTGHNHVLVPKAKQAVSELSWSVSASWIVIGKLALL